MSSGEAENTKQMSLLKIGEYVTSPPFRRVLIEACSLDNTSAPSRFKGHVEDTTNLASKSGSGKERIIRQVHRSQHTFGCTPVNEESGRFFVWDILGLCILF